MWITRLFRMAHARSSAARAEILWLCAKRSSGRLHGWRRRHRAEAVPPHEERAVRHAFAYAGCADLYARQEIASVFAGEHYLDFAGLFDTIHAEDVQEMFRRWAQPNRSTMSVVEPK